MYEYGLKVIIQDFHNSFDTFHEKIDNYYYRQYLELEMDLIKEIMSFMKIYFYFKFVLRLSWGNDTQSWKYRDDISCMFNIDQLKLRI